MRVLLVVLVCYQLTLGQNLKENSTGSFVFTPQAPLNRPPVEVFYHIPQGAMTTMPILMSFHGSSRDGANHRDYWIDMANENGFMVFAPEFSSSNYPGLGDNYIMSNIFDDGDNPSASTFNDKNEWTGSILDPLFNFIKSDISGVQESYSAWGHSAGAQFLHRIFMYLPNSKMNIAVCSNAGWYTVPENSVSFPYGLLNGNLPANDLDEAFTNHLIIHLGQDDTIPSTSAGGPRNNVVVNNQQGLTRLDRGRYFFNTSQLSALNLNSEFNWEIHEVPNVGHSAQQMANDALKYLLPNLLSLKKSSQGHKFLLHPNPAHSGYTNITSSSKEQIRLLVFDALGKQLKDVLPLNNRLNTSDLKVGIYFIRIIQNGTISSHKLIVR